MTCSLIVSANTELAVTLLENKVAATTAIIIFFVMLSLVALNHSINSVQFQFSVYYLSVIMTSTARSPSQPTLASPRVDFTAGITLRYFFAFVSELCDKPGLLPSSFAREPQSPLRTSHYVSCLCVSAASLHS